MRNETASDLAFDAARPEATRYHDAADVLQLGLELFGRHQLGVDPVDIDVDIMGQTGMRQRF